VSRKSSKRLRSRHIGESRNIADLAVVLVIVVADVRGYIPFSSTPFLFAVGWISLRLRKIGWREVGFAWPRDSRVIGLAVLVGVGYQFISLYAVEPVLARLTGARPDASLFASLGGNLVMLGFTLAIIWTLAAFGEEMVFRGYLLDRLARLGGRSRVAWAAAAVATSVAFGAGHAYQGVSGVIDNTLTGLVLAGLYVAAGRSLVAPIVAHGTYDTMAAILMFFRKYPT